MKTPFLPQGLAIFILGFCVAATGMAHDHEKKSHESHKDKHKHKETTHKAHVHEEDSIAVEVVQDGKDMRLVLDIPSDKLIQKKDFSTKENRESFFKEAFPVPCTLQKSSVKKEDHEGHEDWILSFDVACPTPLKGIPHKLGDQLKGVRHIDLKVIQNGKASKGTIDLKEHLQVDG